MRPAVLLGAGAATAVDVIPVSLNITGDASVGEGGTAQYTATVTWSNGATTNETLTASWSDNSSYTTISSSGALTALPACGDQSVTVSASYTAEDVTVTDTHAVSILGNHYLDMNIRDDAAGWPQDKTLYSSGLWDAGYAMSAGDQAEIISEWKVITAGSHMAMSNAAGGASGYFHYKGAGLYEPAHAAAGRIVNTVDFSTTYDAIRAIWWIYWRNDDASDSAWLILGRRPTIGTVDYGLLAIRVDRNLSSTWGISVYTGDSSTPTAAATTLNGNAIFSAVQAEFIKGQHVKVRVVNAGNLAGLAAPSWPVSTGGYYTTVSLASGGPAAIVPIMPTPMVGSSQDQAVASMYRCTFELRRIGGAWSHLVDS